MIEASASWIPWLCHEIRHRTGQAFGPESNVFADHNMYVTAQVDDDIPYLVNMVGEDVLLIGTDFGHTDSSSEYDALMKLRNAPDLSESVKLHMLSTNPARLYGLENARPAIVKSGV
jgi:predicted TIM-barrel fold metal-dependent hydrolase